MCEKERVVEKQLFFFIFSKDLTKKVWRFEKIPLSLLYRKTNNNRKNHRIMKKLISEQTKAILNGEKFDTSMLQDDLKESIRRRFEDDAEGWWVVIDDVTNAGCSFIITSEPDELIESISSSLYDTEEEQEQQKAILYSHLQYMNQFLKNLPL